MSVPPMRSIIFLNYGVGALRPLSGDPGGFLGWNLARGGGGARPSLDPPPGNQSRSQAKELPRMCWPRGRQIELVSSISDLASSKFSKQIGSFKN